ncbi:tRNA pseudouridine synthase A, mitochondrial [Tritrichomonas foetus]|uniref:tRNA pseudouridine synthase n=1 Tax=Tritrichomonas foetus TaxID=1144522 RepID=A0A1J4L0W5_9EUKA|nr:tRNA pseudouridine synthase A, mitochondrial [Tritrichomonas foetus]|eukprot:OHT15517.1 tRNA pseudouridine synthase A, mitochondrial [Tritrichomonas foetus]
MGGFFSVPNKVDEEEEQSTIENKSYDYTGQTAVPIVICYSYIGTGYHGLQQNLDQKTIERDLLKVIVDSDLIDPDMIKYLSKIRWSQASRTDAGVHSAAQVVSFNSHFPPGMKLHQVLNLLNSKNEFPSNIWFRSVISVGNQFNAQKYAEYRKYHYLMPLSAFRDSNLNDIKEKVLPLFIGDKNFHNYTRKVSFNNPSAIRTITDFDISEPFEISGEKYVLWLIRGKSFMINQIRKMIATVLAVSYKVLTIEQLERTFSAEKWALARLPGEGLFLDKVEYPGFMSAARKRKDFEGSDKDVEFGNVRGEIEKWKKEVLFPHIAKLVKENDVFNNWIQNVLLLYPPHPASEESKYQKAPE